MMTTEDIARLIDFADKQKRKRLRENIMIIVASLLGFGIIMRFVFTLLNLRNDFAFYLGVLVGIAALAYYPSIVIKSLRRK